MSGADSAGPSRALLVALMLMLAAGWFGTLGYRKLVKPDEGRYAEISREMAASGDWVTPRYNGIKYFEKPVLLYWTTAAAFTLFGESEWAARFWVGLTGFAGILVSFFAARELFGERAGLLAAAVLASSLLWIVSGHVNTTDMGVAFFLHAAVCAFLLAQCGDARAQSVRRWMLVCWSAMALAVLSKGLIGVVLPGLAAAAYVALTRDFGLLRRLHVGKGLLLLLVIAAPWFVLVSWRNPEFPGFFFIHEHFGRYTTVEGYNRAGPWWYFIALLALGMLPWTTLVPGAMWSALRKRPRPGAVEPRIMLALWIVVVTVFFSISRSKLPGYIVPVLPAVAMLTGAALSDAQPRSLAGHFATGLVAAAIVLAGLMFLPGIDAEPRYAAYAAWLRVSALVAAAGSAVALVLTNERPASRAIIASLLVFAAFGHMAFQLVLLGHDSMRTRLSSYDLALAVNRQIDRSQPFYAVGVLDHTLPFYARKAMIPVAFEDELAFGLSIEPQRGIPTIAEFKQNWLRDDAPMALMEPSLYGALEKEGLPMRIVASDERRIVVTKGALPAPPESPP